MQPSRILSLGKWESAARAGAIVAVYPWGPGDAGVTRADPVILKEHVQYAENEKSAGRTVKNGNEYEGWAVTAAMREDQGTER